MTDKIQTIAPVIRATWPPEHITQAGPFLIAQNSGGGNRVRAARLADAARDGSDVSPEEIALAATEMEALGQPVLFMVLDGQEPLDRQLAGLGYLIKDPTLAMTMRCADLAAPPPPVTCFETWPPLAIQDEIWEEGGIGPDRRAIMDRVKGPKISLFGRINDQPAGSAFVAIHGQTAMLHALEITPSARRRGLARHMMRAAGHWALAQGTEIFSLLVTRENQPASGLYTSLGFQAVGQYHYRTKTA